MRTQKIGSRGYLVGFDDPYETYIYAILGAHTRYLCDTFVGPEPMKEALKLAEKEGAWRKTTVVFNTHSDYDHIWGNCAFRGDVILGHELCRRVILEKGEEALRLYDSHRRGDVTLVPPNVTFTRSIAFPEDGVVLWHTPGHTADSCSCLDEIDRVLVVGDNVERPIPYVNDCHFDNYVSTLRSYLELDWREMVTGHSGVQTDTDLLRENLLYLQDLSRWQIDIAQLSQEKRSIHLRNLLALSGDLLKTKPSEVVIEHYRRVLESLRDQRPSRDTQSAVKVIGEFLETASHLRK